MAASLVSALILGMAAFPAVASDHVANAAASPGADVRDFDNPVRDNPGNAQGNPGTVPGEGNPDFGEEEGTPAVDLGLVDDRSGGHGHPNSP
jgi:hypothetical protein